MSEIKTSRLFAWGVAVGCTALSSTARAHESPVPHAHPHGVESMPILAIVVMAAVLISFFWFRKLYAKSEAMRPH